MKEKRKHEPITEEQFIEVVSEAIMSVWLLWLIASIAAGVVSEINHPIPNDPLMALGIQVWAWFIRPHVIVAAVAALACTGWVILSLTWEIFEGILTSIRYAFQQYRERKDFFQEDNQS